MCHRYSLSKLFLAAFVLVALPLGLARAQSYDTFEVLRLQDRTIYIFPRGYVPNAAGPFAPVAYPWYVQPTVASPVLAPAAVFPRDTVAPLSYYGSTDAGAAAGTSSITLRVPENAEVWIQGKKMDEKGTERRFNLPALNPGTAYDYDVRVAWTENGQHKSDTAHLNLRAGDQQSITYVAALSTKQVPNSTVAPPIDEEPGK